MAPTVITYDHPLNERIRTLLRLEDLFAKFLFFSAKPDVIDHHAAIISLFEILEVAGRADLKTDLLQELERQKVVLEALRNNPAILESALNEVLAGIKRTSGHLYSLPGKFGQHLRENEWLMSIKQRTNIPGGVCEFDLPSYHYWLNQECVARQQNLSQWIAPLLPIHDGLAIVLKMLRDSGASSRHTANQGSFQQMLSGKSVQMLRVAPQSSLPCYPEVSANKYAINIRFTHFGSERSRVCDQPIDFDLTLCSL